MTQAIESIGPVRGTAPGRDLARQTGAGSHSALDLRERFEAALGRAEPQPSAWAAAAQRTAAEDTVAGPVDDGTAAKCPAAVEGLPDAAVAPRRGVDEEVDTASTDEAFVALAAPACMPVAALLPMASALASGAAELAPAAASPVPVSATTAAVQRLQALVAPDSSAPWRIRFGGHDAAASGLAALVVTPTASGPAQWQVIASAGMQALLSTRVESLRARLAERGVKGGVIAVSDQEGDDESQG